MLSVFFRFLIERNTEPRLLSIAEPKINGIKSIQDAFVATLKHEQYITALIGNIYELAKIEKDHALEFFIRWYIDEQVEEEANVQDILDKIKIIDNQGAALYMFDQDLASRVYTPSSPYPAVTVQEGKY